MVATVVVGSVNTINYTVYGVFRNNDFRSSDFLAGYGALTRIRHDHWQRYVPFPKDARERAYAMSAAARELKPYFEGDGVWTRGWHSEKLFVRDERKQDSPKNSWHWKLRYSEIMSA